MAKPLAAMTSEELSLLGRYHVAALEHTEETKDLIADFASVLAALEAATEADRLAQRALLLATVPVNRAEYEAQRIVMRVVSLARGPDDLTTSLYEALFPLDIADVLLDEGESLLTDLFDLREGLVHVQAAKELKAQVLAEVEGALAKLGETLAAHAQAESAAMRTCEQAEKWRREFLAAYERDAATIAKLFPGQQKKQDAYFDDRHVDFELMTAEADWWPATSNKSGGRLS